ncbi:MAG: hypothetical protein WBC06_18545, partial [Chitinophagaceae bacterium]
EIYDLIQFRDALILGLFSIGISILLSFFSWLFYKNFYKANLLAFSMICFQFFFGPVHDLLKKTFSDSLITRYSFILPATIILFIFLIVFLYRSKKSFIRTTYYLNILLLILLLIDTVNLLVKTNRKQNVAPTNVEVFNACENCKKPDVYLIIADGYPGKIELRDLFNYDNSIFEGKLAKRGFHVIDSSVSNYNFTQYSISSMLNLDYIDGLVGSNQNKHDISICNKILRNCRTIKFFTSNEYEVFNYSIFDINKQPALTTPTFLPRKTKLITSQTFTNRLIRNLGYHLVTTFKLESSIKQLRNLDLNNNNKLFSLTIKNASKNTEKPKFTYTHLMMPHHPYYFDSKGNQTPYLQLTEEHSSDKSAFLGYLEYSNKKYLELIDQILTSSKTPPIIILMGDHGFREFKDSVDKKYHFMNLNAVYFPDSNYTGFYKGQSNINQFRIILNSQFGQQMPLLKDSSSFLAE